MAARKKPLEFGTQPRRQETPQTIDDWVRSETGEAEKLKQIVIRVSPALHKRVRVGVAERATSVNELVTAFLEREFPGE